jgi:quercetin dioxygenase-like cupin family protein
MSKKRIITAAMLFASGLIAGGLAIGQLNAQSAGFQRAILLSSPVAASDRYQATLGTAVLPIGMATPLHTHPGDEISVLIEGEITLESEGVPTRRVKAGEAFHIPATKRHLAKSVGPVPARIVAIWVVEKGKPLATTAK